MSFDVDDGDAGIIIKMKNREGDDLSKLDVKLMFGDAIKISGIVSCFDIKPYVFDTKNVIVSSKSKEASMQKEADIVLDMLKKFKIWKPDEYEFLINEFNGNSIESTIKGNHILTVELNEGFIFDKINEIKSNDIISRDLKDKDYTNARKNRF